MSMRRIAAVLFVLSLVSPLFAQEGSASLTGFIQDPTKAVIPGVKVTAIDTATNQRFETTTNKDGSYSIVALPVGPYLMQIEKPGFKTILKVGLFLHVQDALEVNFQMAVGSTSESVTVSADQNNINTTNGSVSTVIDQSYVQNMPLNGRSFQDLILLTPGVVTTSPQSVATLGVSGEFSVNGQRTDSNYYSVDGVSANNGATAGSNFYSGSGVSGSIPASTALGTTQALVSVDALQEFRVQSSTYSAEYGRVPGGQFSFVTRSGTNEWHGRGFDYLRNGYFDANDWFNDYLNVPQAALRQNDFGGTLGGPVKIPHVYNGTDRTFFFFSYEGLRLTQPQEASINVVPTAGPTGLRSTAPNALQPVLNGFPLPYCPVVPGSCLTDLGYGFGDFVGAWSNPSTLDAYSIRLDHAFNDRFRLFFRFADAPSNSASRAGGGTSPSMLTNSEFTSRSYTFGFTSLFSNRVSNDFRLNNSSNQTVSATKIDSFGGATPVDLSQLQGIASTANTALIFYFPGGGSILSQGQQSGVQRQWNLVDTIRWSKGRHQFAFGADYRRLAPLAVPYSPSESYYYSGQAAVLANDADYGAYAESVSAAYPLYRNFSAFAQDEWKVARRLTLSLGLRWEVNPAPGVTQGLMPYTLQGSSLSTLALAPQGTPLWNTDWFNFAPRMGAVYILRRTPGWETVVRAGGGVFFDTGQQLGSLGFTGAGFNGYNLTFANGGAFPLPVATLTPPIINPPEPPLYQIYYFPAHLQLPYTLQWNASLQQALGKSEALTMSYVGSHSARLLRETTYYGPTINNPSIDDLIVNDNGLTSDYDALQVQYQRRLAHGLTALASYTWSHCLDYGSNNIVQDFLTVVYVRGNCDFDVRHNFSSAFSYDLPNAFEGWFARAVFGHWGIDDRFMARTGFPVTLFGSGTVDPTTGKFYFSPVNLVPDEPFYVYGSECAGTYANGLPCPGGRAINPAAFCDPSVGPCAGGTAPRNFLRGFGAWQMDLAVRREFPIRERLKLQFRAETFNTFNHPNFGRINEEYCSLNVNSPSYEPGCTFGQAVGTLASNLGVVSPIYQQGGPRSMQFALKLTF